MVHVQSSWFPLIDRNPQTFTNINTCGEEAFIKATQNQTGILSTESEAVGQYSVNALSSGFVGDVVEVAIRVQNFIVDRGMNLAL